MRLARLLLGVVLVVTILLPMSSKVRSIFSSKSNEQYTTAELSARLRYQQKDLVATEKNLGPVHPDTAIAMDRVAKTYVDLAQYDKALPLLQRVLAIRETVLGSQDRATALALSNLASIYTYLAQYDKALPLQQRALAIYEKILGTDDAETAFAMNGMAGIYTLIAQYDKALPLLQRSLSIHEKVYGSEHADTALVLNRLAMAYTGLAQYEKALPLLQRALAVSERIRGPAHPDTAVTLRILAGTYSGLAQYEKALPLLQRVLAISERVFGSEHPDAAMTLNNIAVTYMHLGQYEKALPMQQKALAIDQKVYGPEHPATGRDWSNLAQSLFRIGQLNEAIVSGKQAVNSVQTTRTHIATIGVQEEKDYSNRFSFVYADLATWLTESGRISEAQMVLDMLKEEEQFEFIRRSSTGDPRSTRIGLNSTEQVWMNRYRQIADRLAALGLEENALKKQTEIGLSQEQKERQKVLAADLKVAQQAFDSFITEMREGFARQGPVRTVETEELSQKAMHDQQNLVKGMGNDVALLRYYVAEDKVGMLLTTSGVPLARSTKVSAKELNRQIAEFRRSLRDPKSNPLPVAQALYQLLVAPIAQDLEHVGAKTVMLSLDGALRYLPFGALHDGKQYLVQRWNLPMYTSVTRNRLRDAVMPQWQAAGLGVTRALGEFSALPAVKVEMSGIIKTAGGGVLSGEVYLDEAFTAQRLQDVSKRNFQLLHLASHFRFSPGTEVNSFLLLGDGQQLTLGDIRTQNYRFDNVDLLTLSACETGLGGGRDEKGREIEGFGVIAQLQGAKAVLATLWPVADQSTATLMAEMYRRRQDQHLTKIEALRQAQLSLMAQGRYTHPFYWAPFILMGNWK